MEKYLSRWSMTLLACAIFFALAVGGYAIWSSYTEVHTQITTRTTWLGRLSSQQHQIAQVAILGAGLLPEDCASVALEVEAAPVGPKVHAAATALSDRCAGSPSGPIREAERLSAINDAVTTLSTELRSEVRRYNRIADQRWFGTLILLAATSIATTIFLSVSVRQTKLRRMEEETNQRMHQEVEERHRVAEALKQSEERLATTLFSIRDAVIATDEQGKVDLMNPVAERLTGWELDQARGRALDEVLMMVQEGTNRSTGNPFEHISRGGGTEPRRQVRVVGRDGSSTPVERTVAAMMGPRSFLGVVVGLRDMSEERRAAADLEQVQRDFRQVIERSPDGVAIQRDGLLVYVNLALTILLGYRSRESLLDHPLLDLVHPAQRADARVHLRDPDNQTLPGTSRLLRFLKASGDVVDLELSQGVGVTFEGERAVLFVARDVTARQRMTQRLVQLDRLSSVGSLAGGIVHQLNNPLAVATVALQQALEELPGEEPRLAGVRRGAMEGLKAVDAIGHLVRDLEAFSGAGSLRPAPIDVQPVLEGCLRIAAGQLRPRATCQVSFLATRPIWGNEHHLRHLLVNLLMYASSQLDEARQAHNLVRLEVEDSADWVRITMVDNGAGMGPEELGHVFDPLYNPQRVSLALCQSLVLELNGTIDVDSAPGRGTRVTLRLPAAAAPAIPSPAAARPNGRRPLRILIVDDEEKVAEALRRLLRPHQVDILTSGAAALERLLEDPVDVIICDLMMDGMSGMDLYDALRMRRPELAERIVFMTGGAYTNRSRSFLDMIPNHRLNKPFQTDVIQSILATFVAPEAPEHGTQS
jgi:PAS domain S-box-containing protein